MAAASSRQPFQEGKRRQQHLPLHRCGSALPSVYRDTAPRQASSVPPPTARPVLSSPLGRSATEARALKVHSDAERRRRERINAHLAALRRMVPDARQVRQPLPIPAEANGITVDCYTGAAAAGYGRPATYIRASVSCDDRPGLLADLAGAFRGLRMRSMRADMASLGGRARWRRAGRVKALEEGVRQALASAAFPETAYGCNYRSRRQRVLDSHYALGHELGVGDHHGW
ncbi:transcription factor bHLH51-like [Panicum miliaceum]|uniref:Transcription factor bHLH51-like n=1 Tax=Panicum miliaceum TaxID=4540 RepID=A0A3L6T5P7_PANMI|nr:transcription factor bHLH51-like [Panicum miliaceum]